MVATYGEVMMRLTAMKGRKLLQSSNLELNFAGSESNVAVNLSFWGLKSKYLTVLPENEFGQMVLMDLSKYLIDISSIRTIKNTRLGLLFLEVGANQRQSRVIYDRKNSAFASTVLDKNYFQGALHGSDWLHWSGITPALSKLNLENLVKAISVANNLNIKTSCDLNYRSSLWDYGFRPDQVMPSLLENTNVIIGNEEDANIMLNLNVNDIDVEKGQVPIESYKRICENIFNKYPKCETIAFSLRESISANHNNWSAILARRDKFITSTKYMINNIVDRVGAGDSFASGIIYGLNNFNNDYKKTLEFATAASCLKHSIPGDYCLASKNDIIKLLDGNSTGRIDR